MTVRELMEQVREAWKDGTIELDTEVLISTDPTTVYPISEGRKIRGLRAGYESGRPYVQLRTYGSTKSNVMEMEL